MSDKQINKQKIDFCNIEEELRLWYDKAEVVYLYEAVFGRDLGSHEGSFHAQLLGLVDAFEEHEIYGPMVPRLNVKDGIGDLAEASFKNFHSRLHLHFGGSRGRLTRKAEEEFKRYGFVPQYEVNIDKVPRFEPETGLKPLFKASKGTYILENRLDDDHRRKITANLKKAENDFDIRFRFKSDNPTKYAFNSLNDAIAGAKVYYDYVKKQGL